MMIDDIIKTLEQIAPLEYAADWDNVGLLIGSRQWPADAIMLTIDLTHEVLREAIDAGANVIIAYHPPIFAAIKSITDQPQTRVALEAARAGIAVYSPHTALDAAPGGINDWLAGSFGSGDVRALQPHASLPPTEQCKIITFCPEQAVDQIRNGLASIGAGRIGDYELCSFEIPGRGTFRGGESTRPAVGKRGVLERVDEIRLEMVCPQAALALAVMALREFHPYEEPPIEVYALQPRPRRDVGHGRRVVLDQPASLKTILDHIKRRLNVKQLQVGSAAPRAGNTRGSASRAPSAPGSESRATHQIIGVCAGAGGSLLHDAIDQGCTLYVTGEMRHHDVLAAQARGCTVVLAGHTNTERGYLRVLRKKMSEQIKDAQIILSRRDGEPLKMM